MDYNQPLVSVIIPTRNSARTLAKCLASVKNQSYRNIELIVVDNNSTDKTKEIARQYTDKVFNYGPERSAQRNFGSKQAQGEYLLIHDSDIYFHPDSVRECMDIIENDHADAVILPEKSIGIGFWARVKAFERSFYVGNNYIEGIRFFRKDIYDKLGGYDKNLTGPEDWDLTIRFRRAGYKISRISSFIQHDEGKIDIFGSSQKKKYYSKDMFGKYAQKYPEEFKRQMSFFIRFPFREILKKSLMHPVLSGGMIFMKGLEFLSSKRS